MARVVNVNRFWLAVLIHGLLNYVQAQLFVLKLRKNQRLSLLDHSNISYLLHFLYEVFEIHLNLVFFVLTFVAADEDQLHREKMQRLRLLRRLNLGLLNKCVSKVFM